MLTTVIRCVALVVGFVYAFVFIQSTLMDWSENPVVTVIETMSSPVSQVAFPAVTVCLAETEKPFYSGFLETFLDFAKLQCDMSVQGDCNSTLALRAMYSHLLETINTNLHPAVESFVDQTDVAFDYDNSNWAAAALLQSSQFGADLMTALRNMRDRCDVGQCDFYSMMDPVYAPIKDAIEKGEMVEFGADTIDSEQPVDMCLNSSISSSCPSEYAEWIRLSRYNTFAQQPVGYAGSFLRRFANDPQIRLWTLQYSYNDATFVSPPIDEANEAFSQHLANILENLFRLEKPDFIGNVTHSLADLVSIVTAYFPTSYDTATPPFASTFDRALPLVPREERIQLFKEYYAAWRKYLQDRSFPHPCSLANFTLICHVFTDPLEANSLATLKILRFALPHAKARPNMADLIRRLYNGSLSFLGMDTYPIDFDFGLASRRFDGMYYFAPFNASSTVQLNKYHALVPVCSLEGKWEDESGRCSLFEPVWTDNGICAAFNAVPFGSAIKNFPSAGEFEQVFVTESKDKIIRNVTSAGPAFGLYLVLDRGLLDSALVDPSAAVNLDPNPASFLVSVNAVLDFFKVRMGSKLIVNSGQQVTLKITPTQVYAAASLRDLPPQKRRCRFSDEVNDLEAFVHYTQATCQFECALRIAANDCQCVPYNYPKLPSLTGKKLCDFFGAYCFDQAMANSAVSVVKDCDCAADCEEVTYSYSVNTVDIDVGEACPSYTYTFNPLQYYLRQLDIGMNLHPSRVFWANYRRFVYNASFASPAPLFHPVYCGFKVANDIAVVKLEIATSKILRGRQEEKSTFEEKLAFVGGTIGLFNGMSFITLVDIGIWISVFVIDCNRRRQPARAEEAKQSKSNARTAGNKAT